MTDDREEFEALKARSAAAMMNDNDLQRAALEVIVAADRYRYGLQWTWLGLPILQIPQDILALQEVVWKKRPQLIIETGVARGGSLALFASLLELLGEGKVIGVDIDIRAHNKSAIETHPMAHRIEMVEGSSVDEGVVERIRAQVRRGQRVMVVLDSNHSHAHVLAELRAYAPLVTLDQYLVVADTIVQFIGDLGYRGDRPWGVGDNPMTALDAYLTECDRFEVDAAIDAKLLFSACPRGYLRCVKD
jgi:cephalosporin hydroxylase